LKIPNLNKALSLSAMSVEGGGEAAAEAPSEAHAAPAAEEAPCPSEPLLQEGGGDTGYTGERGEKGQQGERGERGERGEKGERGERGEIGPTGDVGQAGNTGTTGPTGMEGLIGPTGAAGSSLGGNGISENFMVAGGMGNANKLIYSYDGITWNGLGPTIFGTGTSACYSVTWNSNLWVVGGQDSNQNGVLGHSPDGIRWTSDMNGTGTTNTFANGACYGIAYSSPTWVAVGFNATNGVIAKSIDGINWSPNTPGTILNGKWNAIAINNNIWIAGGYRGAHGIIAHSTDAVSWTIDMSGSAATNLFAGGSCYTITSNGRTVLAGGKNASHGVIAVSTDSVNWTTSGTGAFVNGVCNSIAWNSSIWVAAGSNTVGGILAHSYDGVQWFPDISGSGVANMFAGGVCYTVAWNGTIWVAGGWDGVNAVVVRSYDGINWTTEFSGSTNPPNLLFGGPCFALTARRACCGGGGNKVYNDPWIQKYFIDAPPCIVFQKVTTTSTEISVPWIYPTQMPIGLVCSWIPIINTLSSVATIDISNTTVTIPLLTDVSNNYLNYHNGTPYVTGIVLSNMAGTNAIEVRTFPGDSSSRSAYVYHNTDLTKLVDNSNNILRAWYSNCNPNSCKSPIYLPSFKVPGPPGPPIMVTLIFSTATSGTLTYSQPTLVDITDPASKLTIIKYTLTYRSTGSPYRYYGPVPYTLTTVDNGTQLTYLATNLYPDSRYIFTATATNTPNLTGAASDISNNSLPLSPIGALSGTIPFPDRYYTNGTSTRITGNTVVTRLVKTTTPWSSSAFAAPIHNQSQRGNLQPLGIIATESLKIENNSITTNGPSIDLSGFPVYTVTPVTTNIMRLSMDISDSYTAVAQDGFYLQANNIVTLETPIFAASSKDYTVTLSQTRSFIGSKVFTYQYDLPPPPPEISGVTFKFDSAVEFKPVSGVNVIYGTPKFIVNVVTANMGNYYYSSPLLNYTNAIAGDWTPTTETDLTNVKAASIVGGAFVNPVIIERTLEILTNLVDTYKNAITLSVKANNVDSSTIPFVVTPIKAIVDGPSKRLVYDIYPQSIQSLTNGSSAIGFRIQSGTAGAANVPPFTQSGGQTWASTGYDNKADISSLQELQISNGHFTTPGTETYSYIDYRTYKYTDASFNTVNYLPISTSGFRYASFAWRVPAAPTVSYTYLSFTIRSKTSISVINNLACVGGTPIQFYYRYEDAASPSPTGLASLTSAWINGNSTTGTQTGSGNYYLPLSYTSTPNWGLTRVTQSGNDTTLIVQITPLRIQSGTFNIYARIGSPMNVAFSFSVVSAILST
jgi:hypothetical protein